MKNAQGPNGPDYFNHRYTNEFMGDLIDEELAATQEHVIKVKGAVQQQDLPEGWKVISVSGYIIYNKTTHKPEYTDGETIIAYTGKNLVIAQKGRMDLCKLKGSYPVEKSEMDVHISPEDAMRVQVQFRQEEKKRKKREKT